MPLPTVAGPLVPRVVVGDTITTFRGPQGRAASHPGRTYQVDSIITEGRRGIYVNNHDHGIFGASDWIENVRVIG